MLRIEGDSLYIGDVLLATGEDRDSLEKFAEVAETIISSFLKSSEFVACASQWAYEAGWREPA